MSIDPDGLFTKLFPEVWVLQDPEDALNRDEAADELGISAETAAEMDEWEINGRLAAQRTWLIVRSALQQKKLLEEALAVEERRSHR